MYNMRSMLIQKKTRFFTVPCQGIYQRKYAVIHGDRNIGTTTAKKLWMDARGNPAINNESEGVVVNCNCCTSYKEWTQKHPSLAKSLLKAADSILYYRLCPNESVTVVIDGNKYTYTGTIRASTAAPKGTCIGVASNTGQHPYTCAACYAVTRGKVSPLNRIVNRAPTLKHP